MEKEKQFPKILLTGDRPTGRLHLGHLVGSINNRLKLQDDPTITEKWYMVADVQALTDNADNPDKVRNNVLEVVLDNLACGVDPSKMTFFIQSQVPAIAELTVFFMNLVTMQQMLQNPTIKTEAKEKEFSLYQKSIEMHQKIKTNTENDDHSETSKDIQNYNDIIGEIKNGMPLGFLSYPVSQAADILFGKANIIPVGEDQLPVLEVSREIARKFNRIYGAEIFPEPQAILSEVPRLIGTDGNAKMSKSLGNTIYLSDTKEEIEKKVMSMYTDPGHINIDSAGKVEGNVVFAYLDVFDTNKEELEVLKNRYRTEGEKLGDVEIKKRLIEILEGIIAPIREKREYLARDPKAIMDIVHQGTRRAQKKGEETMAEVKRVMKINYF
jgi:tryptophanyl-tRNA synthetase